MPASSNIDRMKFEGLKIARVKQEVENFCILSSLFLRAPATRSTSRVRDAFKQNRRKTL
jgi:hypothetical protein